MAKITRQIGIRAPAERVFSIVTNPENWPRFVSGLIEVRDLSPDMPARGGTFTWEYNLMGKRITGRGEITEYEKNKKCALALTGEFSLKETYEFVERPEGTELDVEMEYELPAGQEVSGAGIGVLDKVNEVEAGTILEKIRILSEEKALKS
ncbi:MAG: SRPBCC family protein [Nitrospiraceae bacterium]|nr:SRPBCC family protein [Nitrospiraceae bacterium]